MQIRPWTLGANAFPESYQPQPPETGPTYSADAQADAESVKKLQKKKTLGLWRLFSDMDVRRL